MSRYPAAAWRPVDRYQSGPLHVAMSPRRLVFHTAVTNATPSLHSFFNVEGRATPHFYIGKGGEVEQYIDTDFRGSANLDGNWNIIGVETWDGFGATWDGGGQGPEWTPKQEAALAALAVWCAKEHRIPLRRLRSSRRLARGIGWHRLGIDGNFPDGLLSGRKPLGEHWSTSFGKVCPTNTRIGETLRIIRKAHRIVLDRDDATPPKDDRPESPHTRAARRELRKAIRGMKPSKRRSKLKAALRLIRGALGANNRKAFKGESERRPDTDRRPVESSHKDRQ